MIKWIDFEDKGDSRGGLVAVEANREIPFAIERVYYIFKTIAGFRRGYHAHKKLKQVIIPVSGSCKFLLDDGKKREEILLDSPHKGLYIEGLVWREMFDFSDDCVLVVFADMYYDEEDYIRNYQQFRDEVDK